MNTQQKALRKLCSDGNLSFKKVNKFYFANEDKFNAVDTLECCKHFFKNVTAELYKAADKMEIALKA